MINLGSVVAVCDNSGILKGRCIKVLGNSMNKSAGIGDKILIVVKNFSTKFGMLRDQRKRKRFGKGSMHRALVIRAKKPYKRGQGAWLRFTDNAVILIDRKGRPLAKRVKGPVLVELTRKFPGLSSITRDLL